jgi:hypothetical protein
MFFIAKTFTFKIKAGFFDAVFGVFWVANIAQGAYSLQSERT